MGCSQHGFQSQRLVLDPSNKLPLYRRTGVKAPSPQIQSQEPSTQAPSQGTSASSGQYCIYQKPKQVTCNVAHMKRVTHQFKYYCGTQSQQKVCTGHRCVIIITEFGPWTNAKHVRANDSFFEFKFYMLTFLKKKWMVISLFSPLFPAGLRLGCAFHDEWDWFDTWLHFMALEFPASSYSGRSHI